MPEPTEHMTSWGAAWRSMRTSSRCCRAAACSRSGPGRGGGAGESAAVPAVAGRAGRQHRRRRQPDRRAVRRRHRSRGRGDRAPRRRRRRAAQAARGRGAPGRRGAANADRGPAAPAASATTICTARWRRSFPHVQMLGVTPFLGMGVVEFEGAVDGLRIDSRLVKEGSEPPAAYVAVAGTQVAPGARLRAGAAAVRDRSRRAWPRGGAGRRRRRARPARGDRRAARPPAPGAEDRAALDAEVGELRRALAEADESVIEPDAQDGGRDGGDGRAAVGGAARARWRPSRGPAADAGRRRATRPIGCASRLAEAEARASAAEQRLEEVGGAARASSRPSWRMRSSGCGWPTASWRARAATPRASRTRRRPRRPTRERARGARSGAIAARDERIARLEGEKQDLDLAARGAGGQVDRDDRARGPDGGGARGRPVSPTRAAQPTSEPAPAGDAAPRRWRASSALEEFHRAAAAHVDELTELKASVAEQSALVAELEDAVRRAEARAAAASADATTLRKTAKDLEEADRSRRSRLAELEGKLLRLEHERKAAPPPRRRCDEERARLGARARPAARRRSRSWRPHRARHERPRRQAAEKLDAMAARRRRTRRRPTTPRAGSRTRWAITASARAACATSWKGSAAASTRCLRRRSRASSRSWARIWPSSASDGRRRRAGTGGAVARVAIVGPGRHRARGAEGGRGPARAAAGVRSPIRRSSAATRARSPASAPAASWSSPSAVEAFAGGLDVALVLTGSSVADVDADHRGGRPRAAST